MAALRSGRSDAQAELVRRHHRRVCSLLRRLLGSDQDLADLVQDVFYAAFVGAPGFRGDASQLEGWVSRITIFTARGVIRRRSTWRRFFVLSAESEAGGPWHDPAIEDVAAVRHTYAILDKLPADERIVLVLHTLDEMPLPEVAEATGFSLSTVKRRLRKARARFEALAARDPVLRDRLVGRSGDEGGDP